MANQSLPPRVTGRHHNGASRGTSIVDLSHEIVSGSTGYPGLPQPELTPYITHEESRELYDPGYTFSTGKLCMVGQSGTYMDVPFHAFADGFDLTRLDLRQVVNVPVTLIETDKQEIPPEVFAKADLTGHAVLIRTGWSRFWETEAYANGQHPHLSADAAKLLAEADPSVVGIDSLNMDGTHTGSRPAHHELLGAGIPLVEHLTNLDQVPDKGARFTAVPVKVSGLGTFPVRAFASWTRWM
ncbi:cyclase family protein [Streptomyces daliensis]|uniref:Cyclase family protein n=1 Tax=Streptomyces daliensis TaxID=299421 RepID=A0A8T4IM75_9ACTN|nr:cyclase family protein [Streptomyces daliensis]